ncbi:MAG: hypothetical protein ISN29_12535 [Gammaproteobacteria bacterium AqS3]|nr:hypothetical protein [Gammaproteobacteria bacterium AqS3]
MLPSNRPQLAEGLLPFGALDFNSYEGFDDTLQQPAAAAAPLGWEHCPHESGSAGGSFIGVTLMRKMSMIPALHFL